MEHSSICATREAHFSVQHRSSNRCKSNIVSSGERRMNGGVENEGATAALGQEDERVKNPVGVGETYGARREETLCKRLMR